MTDWRIAIPLLLGLTAQAQSAAEAERLLAAGRLDDAWAALQAAPDNHSFQSRLLASRILEARGELPAAAAEAEAAIAAAPDEEAGYLQLGRLFLAGNNPQAAHAVFTDGLAGSPGGVLLRLGQGLALNQLRRYEEASELLASLLREAPDLGLALDALVEADLQLSRFEHALQAAAAYQAGAPNDYRGYYLRALALDRQGQAPPEQVETLLRKALERYPRLSPAYALLGKTLLRLDRPEEAALMLESGLRLEPDDRLGRMQLARAYHQLGRRDDARREMERVRRLEQAERELRETLRRREVEPYQ